MYTDTPTDVEGTEPAGYTREDGHSGPRWTHQQTGLRVELVQTARPQAGRLTRSNASGRDAITWTIDVRPDGPDGYAEIHEPLGGGRDAAIAYAREWMREHPCGVLMEAETA